MYMAEAYCMLGKFQEALEQLEKAEGVCADHSDSNGRLVKQVEHKFRTIKVSNVGAKD